MLLIIFLGLIAKLALVSEACDVGTQDVKHFNFAKVGISVAYADDINILGGSVYILKENAEALVAATREIGLEVSADKSKYMVMSRDQNAGRNHSVN
jgi:hypothetical protein